ncbi:MAG TPA: MAPEG family protein [Kiloniellales bacterium]
MISLAPELFWLTLTALMTAVIWVPYILNRIVEMGLWGALKTPGPEAHAKAAWAQRLQAAHVNAVENLVIFAPLAIAVHVAGAGTPLTALAAATYFYTRLAHVIVYTLGIPGLRTLTFAIGFIAQVILAFALLGWM